MEDKILNLIKSGEIELAKELMDSQNIKPDEYLIHIINYYFKMYFDVNKDLSEED